MKCPACGFENKDTAKACRKCGRDATVPPAWLPDARWHLKLLAVIYASLIAFYYGVTAALSALPRPYQLRHIPVEMTPWLAPGGKVHLSEEQLQPPARPARDAAK